MRNSTAFTSRWAAAFVALALLPGVLIACIGPPPVEDTIGVTEGTIATIGPPTGSVPPGETLNQSTTVPAAPTLAVAHTDAPEEHTNGESSSPPVVAPVSVGNSAPIVPDEAANLMLAAFEQVLNGIYESVVPSVVYIRVPRIDISAFQGLQGVPDELLFAAGSGFVWDEQGHIVTNHHVIEDVADGSEQVTVIFADATQVKGTVIGSDPHSDLAVISLEDGDWNLQPVLLGDSSHVKVGQLTVAIGAPFGQEFTMTSGIVSAVGRNISGQAQFTIPEVIQTDSAINPGNSGGPLLDRLGRVIGVNTQIISRTGSFSGVGMAVPVNIAKRVVPPLIANGEFDYPWLGVSITSVQSSYVEELGLPEGTKGALIISIVEDSPADGAGLRGSDSAVELEGTDFPAGGDIITSVNGHEIAGSDSLIAHLLYHNMPGDTVILTVLRDGQREAIQVTLGQRPTIQ